MKHSQFIKLLAALGLLMAAATFLVARPATPAVAKGFAVPHFAPNETLNVPFTGGVYSAQTANSYSGNITVVASGIGEAAGIGTWSDAFYFISGPTQGGFSLAINGTLAKNYVGPVPPIVPPYNSSHVYTFTMTAVGARIWFGVDDGGTGDNSGAYTIKIYATPSQPTISPISNVDLNGDYTVSWNSIAGADSYTLEEDDNVGFSSPTEVYSGTNTSHNVTGQLSNTWYYRVKASNVNGSSAWSSGVSVNVILTPAAPVLNTIPSPDIDGNYPVTWSSVSGAVTYTLEIDDNASFTSSTEVYSGSNTTHNVTSQPIGTSYYRVKASNASGDSAWSNNVSVTVVSYVTSLNNFTGPTTGSTNTSHSFNITVSPANATFPIIYTWQASDLAPIVHTVNSINDNVSFSWPTPGFKLVTVTVTNGGASVSSGANVTIYQPPQANFQLQPTIALTNQTIYFTNTTVGSYTTVLYDFGDNTVSGLSNPTHKYAATGTKIITLTVSGYGLSSTLNKTVTIGTACSTSFTLDRADGPAPFTVTASDTSTGDCPTTVWHWGEGNPVSNTLNPTHTYNASGNFTVMLTKTGVMGSVVTQTNLVVHPRAEATITATPVTGETPLTVTFTSQMTNVLSFTWNFGDGTAQDSLNRNPSHVYQTGGNFNATLIVTGSGTGNSVSKVVVITPTTTLKPLFTVAPISGTVPPDTQICFNNGSTPVDAASSWNFGDGSGVDTNRNTCHFYKTAGIYTVTLTLSKGGQTAITQTTVPIYQKCVATFDFSPSLALVGQTVLFTNTTQGDCNTALWALGDGLTSTQTSPSHVYTQAGTFAVKLIMTGNGGMGEMVKQIVITTPTLPVITANPPSGDASLTVQFGLTGNALYPQQTWDFDDRTTSTQASLSHTFFTSKRSIADLPLPYIVKVTLTGPLGTVVVTRPVTVTIQPAANFKLSPASGVTPLTVTMDNLSTGDIATYLWNLGHGKTSTDKIPPPQSYSTGVHTVVLTVTGLSGKVSSHVETITVYEPCVADFTVSDPITASVQPLHVTVHNSSLNCSQFQWEFGDGGASDFTEPDHTYTQAGNFTMKLTATGPVNSSSKSSPMIQVGDPNCQIDAATVNITPQKPQDNDDLIVHYVFNGCTQRQKITEGVSLQWLQNGKPVYSRTLTIGATELERTLPHTFTLPFQQWSAVVMPFKGGKEGGTVGAAEVYIQEKPNTPPTATVTISPTNPLEDDNLTLTYRYFDADGDAEEAAKGQLFWLLDNQLQPAYPSPTVPLDATHAQETWCATVRVYDGKEYGPVAPEACVTIGTGQNHPPQVLSATMTNQRQNAGNILRVTGIYSDVDLPCPNCGKKIETLPQSAIQWFRTYSADQKGDLQPEFNHRAEISRSVTITGELWYATLQISDSIDASAIVQALPLVEIVPPGGKTPPRAENVRIVAIDSTNGRAKSGDPEDNDNLNVEYDFQDNDGQTELGSRIYWYNPFTQVTKYNGQRTIPASETSENQSWYVRVIPCDEKDCGTNNDSDSVQIRPDPYNTPPKAENLRIVPIEPGDSDSLELSYLFKDVDGDIEKGTQIRWTNNGKAKSELDDKSKVHASVTDEEDIWCATVMPIDGRGAVGKKYPPFCVTVKVSSVPQPPRAEEVYITSSNQPEARKSADSENLQLHYIFIDDDCAASDHKTCEHDSEIRWSRNGVNQTAFDNLTIVSATATFPGDKWSATIRPHDGQAFGNLVKSEADKIINHQPTITAITFEPTSPVAGAALKARCGYSDADNDPSTTLSHRWSLGEVYTSIYDNLATLPSQVTQRGQAWTVSCTPHDGIEAGPSLTATVTINSRGYIYLPLIVKLTGSTPTTPMPTSTPGPAFEGQPCDPNGNYEPNNDRLQACVLQVGQSYTAYPNDEKDYYVFELADTAAVSIELTGYTQGKLWVYGNYASEKALVEQDLSQPSSTANIAAALTDLSPGTKYYILIDAQAVSTQPYQLKIVATPKRP